VNLSEREIDMIILALLTCSFHDHFSETYDEEARKLVDKLKEINK